MQEGLWRYNRPQRLTLEEYFTVTPPSLVVECTIGVRVSGLPESLDELKTMIAQNQHPECDLDVKVDDYIDLIGQSSDPDSIVQQLPFDQDDDGALFIHFALPVSNDKN